MKDAKSKACQVSVFKNKVSCMYYGLYIYLCCKARPCVSFWTWFTARAVIELVSTDGRGSAYVFLIRNVCICLWVFDSSFNCSRPDMLALYWCFLKCIIIRFCAVCDFCLSGLTVSHAIIIIWSGRGTSKCFCYCKPPILCTISIIWVVQALC